MFPAKRPTAKETDEDLLKFQEEFLKEKSKAASSSVNNRNAPKKGLSDEATCSKSQKTEGGVDVPSKPVMFNIKERNISNPTITVPKQKEVPFPVASKANTKLKATKRKSIFAQQMEKAKTKNKTTVVTARAVRYLDCPVVIDGSGLGTVSGEMEAKKIHKENIATLSELTEEEILTEKSLLLEKLNPALVEFIKKKRKGKEATDVKNHDSTSISVSKEVSKEKCSLAKPSGPGGISSSKGFPPSNSVSFNEVPEGDKILKMSGGCAHDGIILESIPEGTFSGIQAKKSAAAPIKKNVAEVNESDNIGLPEDELPINPKEASEWAHMDKVEKHKLAWMTMLPKPVPVDLKSGYTARFDFEGKLLFRDEDIPTQKGLHHHAEEPEVPGYTIEELFLLSRSSTQSQRIMALQTLAHIMENNWQGVFDGCFEKPLLSHLLDAGIAPLLRWALDDTTDSSVAAAVMAVHHLLVCPSDELCLDLTFPWTHGYLSPFIKPCDAEEISEESLKDLTDANIIKLDVIKGFLRMDLLLRLRYILVVMCPPFPVCQLIIEILIRIARHSSESAKMVMECPFLLEIVFKKFLPTCWNLTSDEAETKKTNEFAYPLPCAVKLMRIISSSSAELASCLLKTHHLASSLSCYLTVGLSEGKLSAVAMQKLMAEALRCWRVLLAYGFCGDIYVNLFPVIVKQLQYFITISIDKDRSIHASDYVYASVFFKALEAVVIIAKDHTKSLSSGCNPSSLLTSPLLWNQVTGLLPLIENCLQKWLYEFSHAGATTAGTVLLASCIDLYTLYCTKEQLECSTESYGCLNQIHSVVMDSLLPCLKSVRFSSLLDSVRLYSLLLYEGDPGSKRNTNTLASVGSISYADDIVPVLKEGTPFALVASVLGLLAELFKILPTMDEEVAKIILLHPSVIKYMKQLSAKSTHFKHWFDRFEVALLYRLIELASLKMCGDPTVWHKLAVSLLPDVRKSDEWILKFLIENFVFNYMMLQYSDSKFQVLSSEERTVSEASPSSTIVENHCQNVISKEHLLQLGQVYVNFFLPSLSLNTSRQKWQKNVCDGGAINLDDDMKAIVPADWPYRPLSVLYQCLKNSETPSQEYISEVTAFLEWIHLLQCLKLPAFKHILPSDVFSHLAMVFLLGSDFFFDARIKNILESCLCLLMKQSNLNLEKIKWSDILGFDELFSGLVMQFEAESYGEHVFANYLLVAFQQCYPSRWKKFIFVEHPHIVRIIGIPLSKLIVPLVNYLEPKESDTDLLVMYCKVLKSGLLVSQRCPLLYLMAVHHVHSYIFSALEPPTDVQKNLLRNLLQCKNKEVIHHVLLYQKPNVSQPHGFEMSKCLTSEGELYLSSICGRSVSLETS